MSDTKVDICQKQKGIKTHTQKRIQISQNRKVLEKKQMEKENNNNNNEKMDENMYNMCVCVLQI